MDDDAQVRHSLARVIEAHGLATVEASPGAEALAILEREGEIPIVISDIYMPEMDGVDLPARGAPALSRHGVRHAHRAWPR